jgi:FkbM family methyltransferase
MTTQAIVDLGANIGQNIPYYLQKCDLVIAVEANPILCSKLIENYSDEISLGSLIIVNAAIVEEESSDSTNFFVHRTNSVLSQLDPPEEKELFDCIEIKSINLREIGEQFLPKRVNLLYLKSDLEGFDDRVVRQVNKGNLMPKFLSAEIQTQASIAELVFGSKFNMFKLVEGNTVSSKYGHAKIKSKNGYLVDFKFADHSAGPMWDDIAENPLPTWKMLETLSTLGNGWRDLHASQQKRTMISLFSEINPISICYFILNKLIFFPKMFKLRILLKICRISLKAKA